MVIKWSYSLILSTKFFFYKIHQFCLKKALYTKELNWLMVGPKYENSKGAFQNWVIPGFPSIYTHFYLFFLAMAKLARTQFDRCIIESQYKRWEKCLYTQKRKPSAYAVEVPAKGRNLMGERAYTHTWYPFFVGFCFTKRPLYLFNLPKPPWLVGS